MGIEFTEIHLKDMTMIGEKCKSNTHRLDEVEEEIKTLKTENRTLYEMSSSIKILTDGVVSIKDDVKEIRTEQGEMKNEIKDIKDSPMKSKANLVDGFWKLLLAALGSGIIAFFLGQVAPNIFTK